MASSSLSLSLSMSLSNSMSLYQHQHNERRRKVRRLQHHQDGQNQENSNVEPPETSLKEISLFKQLVLTAISFGYSCSIEFEAVYGIVSMQYFGLPVYLVSLPGIISGALNSFLVPLLGRYSDRGPNPLKRKLILLSLTSVCLLTGYATLGVCSYLKLVQMNEKIGHSNNMTFASNFYDYESRHTNNTFTPGIVTSYDKTGSIILNNKTGSEPESVSESEVPTLAIFAVLPFVLYDTGYDTCMAMSRASVLEIVPVQQRNNILTMAGLMSGFAGILAAVVGIIDFPGVFESVFETDGFALSLILFSVFYGLMGLLSSVCSIRAIWKMYCENELVNKGQKHNNDECTIPERPNVQSYKPLENERSQKSNNNDWDSSSDRMKQYKVKSSVTSSLRSLSIDKKSTTDSLSTASEKQPMPSRGYRTFISSTESSSKRHSFDQVQATPKSIPSHDNENIMNNAVSSRNINDKAILLTDCRDFSTNSSDTHHPKNKQSAFLLSISKSYEKALGESHLQKLLKKEGTQQTEPAVESKSNSKLSLCSMSFCICILAIFLCGIAINATTLYQSNTLTLEVFHGDPHALPGTEGRLRYEKGIRTSSFGILTAFSCFFVFLVASPKLINRIGALNIFIITNCLHMVAASLFCAYPRLETYFVLMMMYGVNKSTLLAGTFIIATLYAPIDAVEEADDPDDNEDDNYPSSSPSSNVIGQVIALVAVTVPAGCIILSVAMGPLMDATGNAWPPMYCAIGMAAGAVITGIILSFQK